MTGVVVLVLASSTGGVGRHVASLVTHLTATGRRVLVCGPAATEELFGFRGAGAAFSAVEIPARPDPVRDVRAVLALRAALAGVPVAVVHAHGLRAGLVAALATGAVPPSRRAALRKPAPRRPPLVVTWHNLRGAGAGQAVLGAAERVVARAADVTVGASDDLVRRAWRLGAVDARPLPVAAPVLPPPVRSAAEVRAALGLAGHPVVLSVGRLHPQKRFDVLVDAAARLAGLPGEPIVVVAGSGPDEALLRARAAAAGAPVRFVGHRTDVADLLAACDAAVVTSDWEARQLFAQEALRAGRPLVATGVGGLPGLVGDGAVLVPPGDPAAVAGALAGLLADPVAAGALAARGTAVAASWPDEEAAATAVLALYRELIGPACP